MTTRKRDQRRGSAPPLPLRVRSGPAAVGRAGAEGDRTALYNGGRRPENGGWRGSPRPKTLE